MTVAKLRSGRRIKGEKGQYAYGAPPYGWQALKEGVVPGGDGAGLAAGLPAPQWPSPAAHRCGRFKSLPQRLVEVPQSRVHAFAVAVVLYRCYEDPIGGRPEILPAEQWCHGCSQPPERRGEFSCGDSTLMIPSEDGTSRLPGSGKECRPACSAGQSVGDSSVNKSTEGDPAACSPTSPDMIVGVTRDPQRQDGCHQLGGLSLEGCSIGSSILTSLCLTVAARGFPRADEHERNGGDHRDARGEKSTVHAHRDIGTGWEVPRPLGNF